MKKRNNILLTHFNLDINKEIAIYTYLCKEKLSHKQNKLLSSNTKFESYHSWKKYIKSKFRVYSKPSLIELSRYLNLSLRNGNKLNTFTQGFWMAFISSFLTLFINESINHLHPNLNPLILFIAILLFVPALVFVLISIYKEYNSEEQRVSFYQDVKEIIDEMIEER